MATSPAFPSFSKHARAAARLSLLGLLLSLFAVVLSGVSVTPVLAATDAALGQPATASATYDGTGTYAHGKAVDGNSATYWHSPYPYTTTTWWDVTFGAAYITSVYMDSGCPSCTGAAARLD